jgi:hypothetical protein
MLFIFSTPVSIRNLWHHKRIVFLHWCLVFAVLFVKSLYLFWLVQKLDYFLYYIGSSLNSGVGKLMSPLSANANALHVTFRFPPPLSPYYDVSVVPAGRGGKREVAESMLALAGSGDVNLPTPSDLTHFHLPMNAVLILLVFSVVFEQPADNRRAHIRHLCRKTLSKAATDCLINTGIEKMTNINVLTRILTARCLLVKGNFGISTIVYVFSKRAVQLIFCLCQVWLSTVLCLCPTITLMRVFCDKI